MRHILGRLLNQKKLLCHLINFSLQQQQLPNKIWQIIKLLLFKEVMLERVI